MNTEMIAKWIEALRSGRYKQICGGVYRGGDKFCAIGVGLAVADGIVRFEEYYRVNERIDKAYGLSTCEVVEIIRMNDQDNKSFDEIADYLEAKLLMAEVEDEAVTVQKEKAEIVYA